MNAALRRLIEQAEQAEAAHLEEAAATIRAAYRHVTLTAVNRAVTAALSKPRAQRTQALRGAFQLAGEALRPVRLPPADLHRLMRDAVRDRVLNAGDIHELLTGARTLTDTQELEAHAVRIQRQSMNRYWSNLPAAFRDDVARTIREGIRRGLSESDVTALLSERLNVNQGRARLIWLDQTRTAQSRAEIDLLKAASLPDFQWWSVRDATAREEHAARHGRVYTWRAAPDLPGSLVNCRCRALPVSRPAAP